MANKRYDNDLIIDETYPLLNDIPISILIGCVAFLIFLSAFFSSAETSMMALNRYRLRHLEKKGHSGAKRAASLLRRPDRLIGVILIGNNLVNTFAATLTTVIALRLYGEAGVWYATLVLTLAILLFAEITPKTVAALHPEKVAFPFSWILQPLLKLLYPAVWSVNAISNRMARLFGVDADKDAEAQTLNPDELRTVLNEGGDLIPQTHQDMLLNILDLDEATVDDIMIPRNEVIGINLEDSIEFIAAQLESTDYTRLPVYEGDINNVLGILHLRYTPKILKGENGLSHQSIRDHISQTYFVPESTSLHKQLINFKDQKHNLALVVDEYGEVQGLITLADLLEEIVGDFTTNFANTHEPTIIDNEDNWYTFDGGASIREINKSLNWELPTDGPKTLNGLFIEHLEEIPKGPVSFIIGNYRFETLTINKTMIDTAKGQIALSETE